MLTRRRVFVLAAAGVAAGCSTPSAGQVPPPSSEPVPPPPPAPPPPPPPEPPRLIGYCGAPGTSALGPMTGDLTIASERLREQIDAYPADRPVSPVVELIATTVQADPGADGLYRSRAADEVVDRYLQHARDTGATLLLNIQPGHAAFLPEVRAYEHWLAEPDVGVALDPEWAVDDGVVPGTEYGHVTGADLDEVAGYLAELARRHGTPPTLMVYHQVATSVVRDEADLLPHEGVTPIKVVDGIGHPDDKRATWAAVVADMPEHVQTGFKLFYDEDTRGGSPLMGPDEVLALSPEPGYIVYE